MRKSNWSDLPSALAISARDRVRRLLESATMNARAVISAMKTFDVAKSAKPGIGGEGRRMGESVKRTFACLAE